MKSITIGVDEDGVATEAPLVVPEDGSAATTSARAQRKVKLPPSAQVALGALIEALDELGEIPPESDHIPPHTKAVKIEHWRDYAYRRGITSSHEPRARQQAFNRAGDALRSARRIGTWEPFVWLTAS